MTETGTEPAHATDRGIKQLISFCLGSERFGLDILRVKEVVRMSAITRLPQAPKSVRGVINLRGVVIPIVDLRERFGLAPSASTDATRVIVVDVNGRSVGMVVDAANDVVRIPDASIEPTPPMIGGLPARFITGVGKLDEELIILVDVDRILSGDEPTENGPIASDVKRKDERQKSAPAVGPEHKAEESHV